MGVEYRGHGVHGVNLEKCVVNFVPVTGLFCSGPSEVFLSCIMSLALESFPARSIRRLWDFSFKVRTPNFSHVVEVYTGVFLVGLCEIFHLPELSRQVRAIMSVDTMIYFGNGFIHHDDSKV